MTIALTDLKKRTFVEKVIIHSHDLSLYLLSVVIDGTEHYVIDDQGRMVRSFNKLDLQGHFSSMTVGRMVLRQQSAYDEMVGASFEPTDNTMEVLIGGEAYGVSADSADSVH
jgi:hypothetical protein